jgi:hypothetical protein
MCSVAFRTPGGSRNYNGPGKDLQFGALCEARAELIQPATDRLMARDDAALEQQFFNITRAELKAEIPAYCLTDGRRPKPATVIERFRSIARTTLPQRDNAEIRKAPTDKAPQAGAR